MGTAASIPRVRVEDVFAEFAILGDLVPNADLNRGKFSHDSNTNQYALRLSWTLRGGLLRRHIKKLEVRCTPQTPDGAQNANADAKSKANANGDGGGRCISTMDLPLDSEDGELTISDGITLSGKASYECCLTATLALGNSLPEERGSSKIAIGETASPTASASESPTVSVALDPTPWPFHLPFDVTGSHSPADATPGPGFESKVQRMLAALRPNANANANAHAHAHAHANANSNVNADVGVIANPKTLGEWKSAHNAFCELHAGPDFAQGSSSNHTDVTFSNKTMVLWRLYQNTFQTVLEAHIAREFCTTPTLFVWFLQRYRDIGQSTQDAEEQRYRNASVDALLGMLAPLLDVTQFCTMMHKHWEGVS